MSVTTLDNLITEYGLPKFCKIDVEGFEEQVLRGLIRPIPYLSFEFHKSFFDEAKKCIDQLVHLGNVKFNVCFGTSMEFVFKQWVGKDELLLKIEKTEGKDLWGDIYIKYN